MQPGEAQRKLEALREEHEEILRRLKVYEEFFLASYAMNVAAASLPEAERVRSATTACAAERVRSGIGKKSAMDELKLIAKNNA